MGILLNNQPLEKIIELIITITLSIKKHYQLTFSMYRLRFELKGFLHVGQFSHMSTHLLQIKCPSKHWKIGGTICSKHTGHSNKRIN